MTARKTRAERAAARATWPGGKFRLGNQPTDDLSGSTTIDERLAMMWRLAQDAWAASATPMPQYPRSQIPGRVIRKTDG